MVRSTECHQVKYSCNDIRMDQSDAAGGIRRVTVICASHTNGLFVLVNKESFVLVLVRRRLLLLLLLLLWLLLPLLLLRTIRRRVVGSKTRNHFNRLSSQDMPLIWLEFSILFWNDQCFDCRYLSTFMSVGENVPLSLNRKKKPWIRNGINPY